jgi:hypothetical protein
MKRRFTILGLCTLLAVIAMAVIHSSDRQRRAAQQSKARLVVAPDGTISVPRNDNMRIVAEASAFETNASPRTPSATK